MSLNTNVTSGQVTANQAPAAEPGIPATQFVADTAYNLLNAPAAAFTGVKAVTLIGSPTLSFAQLARLEMLPGFNIDPSARIRLADSLTNINAVLAADPAWFSAISILDVQLEGGGIGAALASRLVDLERQGLDIVFTPSTRFPSVAPEAAAGGSQKPVIIDVTDYLAGAPVAPGASVSVTCATVAQLDALAELRLTNTTIEVRDSAAAISADLALRGSSAIVALLPHITTIDVSDHGAIILTAAEALSGGIDDGAQSALALSHGGRFAVTDASVAQIAQLDRLPIPPASINVLDRAEAVIAGMATLHAFGGCLRVKLTDTSLSAAQIPALTQVRTLLVAGVPVYDTGLAIATLASSGDAASIAYLNVYGAALCGDSIAALADIEALSWLTRFSKNGHRIDVWDSAQNLTAHGAPIILSSRLVDGIFLRAPAGAKAGANGGDVTLSTAEATALFGIAGFSSANPDGTANRVTVADSAAAIALACARLAALSDSLDSIVVNANGTIDVAMLDQLRSLGATVAAGVSLTVRDTAANLIAGAAAGTLAIASAATLAGPATLGAEDAEALLRIPNLILTSDLTISDRAAVGDTAHPLIAPAEHEPTPVRNPMVTLGTSETVDACTILRLSDGIFISGGNTLTRVGNDLTDAVALKAIAALSAHISEGAADISLAAGALSLNPPEFASLRADTNPPDEHIVAAVMASTGVTESTLHAAAPAAGTGSTTVNLYDEAGALLSVTLEQQGGFTVTAPDIGKGQAYSLTESISGRESSPVVVLDAGTLGSAVQAANAQFATSGAIEVESGKYLDLYTAGSVPVLNQPALVYDPSAHTIALDIPGQPPLPLIVLGAGTQPASLAVDEIVVRKAS